MNVKFAHVSDCHLGAWRKETLNQIGYDAFNKMIETIIEEQVDFVIISGDLYDTSNPKVDVIDLATRGFKRLYDAKLPVYGIMGSHPGKLNLLTLIFVLTSPIFVLHESLWLSYDSFFDGLLGLLQQHYP